MDDRETGLLTAQRLILQRLESLHRAGVEQLPRRIGVPPVQPLAAPNPSAPPSPPSPMPRSKPTNIAAPPPSPQALAPRHLSDPYPADLPTTLAGRQQLLADLNAEVRACTLCRELACTRQQTVFGVGHAKPRVVFFGEAPGADEDRQGEPFVGRAGQLLTKIIEACGWQRSDVYIMNVLKCRPPENRNPSPSETDNCRPFFERQFEILRPEYIVCAGTVPAQALLQTDESVGKLRGRFHRYRDSTVLVTYHPSYLLRNPSAKKHVWDDMQMLLKEMGLPIPKRSAN
jgi:uracil-DNA glycosylase family 4